MKNKLDLSIALDSLYYFYRRGDALSASELEKEIDLKTHSKEDKNLFQLLKLISKYEKRSLSKSDLADMSEICHESFNQMYEGWCHLLEGFIQKNEQSLRKAIALFRSNRLMHELYESLYWLECFKFQLILEEQVFLHLYPIESIYSKLMGNLFYNQLTPLTDNQRHQCEIWGDEDEMNESFDCWLIDGNNCLPRKYNSLKLGDKNFIDFYSGLSCDRGEYIFLFITELNTVSYLISTELIGASLMEISAFLKCSEEKALSVLQSLMDLGFFVVKKNELYFLEWKSRPLFIIPRGIKVIGLQEYAKKNLNTFSKNQLIDLFQLTPHGAVQLIRKWEQAGYIRPANENWTFNS